MLKFLAVPMVAAMLGFGSGQALAFPTQNTGLAQQNFSNVTTVASGQRSFGGQRYYGGQRHYGGHRRIIRRRGHGGHWNGNHGNWNGHHGNWNGHHGRWNRYRNYRPYYNSGFWGSGYCGGGFGYGGFGYGGFGHLPYDCLRGDYSYGGGYYNDDYPRRERVSNRRHVRWCTSRYRTYNASTDTFIGKGKRKYRCNSPYDGRR